MAPAAAKKAAKPPQAKRGKKRKSSPVSRCQKPAPKVLISLHLQIIDEVTELTSAHIKNMISDTRDTCLEFPRVQHFMDRDENRPENVGKK